MIRIKGNQNNQGNLMGMEERTRFRLDKRECIRCGRCVNVCSGMVLRMGKDGFPQMMEFERFGWRGCWKCQHCLAVCPKGAISIFGKYPEDSCDLPPKQMGDYMVELVSTRRSCRRYLDKDVDKDVVSQILDAMGNCPTGGNTQGVEYTVIDDKSRVHAIWEKAYSAMEEKAKRHIYTHSFSEFYYQKMKESEGSIRKGDMLFCGAPHLFIAHAKAIGKWAEDAKADCHIATAYFELLCNAFGLGTIMMSYTAEVFNELALEAREMLGIPKDHYAGLIVGFGYPEIPYARGTQKDRSYKTHRYSVDKNN